ncbi:hypothetical protein [Guptibacillus hwajinpoensis]|uniref:hypothetical protein n=1 Tax=Guptibacillus hwajinpoensis TaxID=208199 RepID=UPI003D02111B
MENNNKLTEPVFKGYLYNDKNHNDLKFIMYVEDDLSPKEVHHAFSGLCPYCDNPHAVNGRKCDNQSRTSNLIYIWKQLRLNIITGTKTDE